SISAVNRLFFTTSINSTETPAGHNLRPASAAHSTRIRHLCNPFQLSNLLIQKAFLLQFAAKVVRIIGGFGWASITNNRLPRN
ncbi:hypothetical protein L3X14_06735, partial [Pseudomonas balearica]|uniref:hypothetical protein n=1 Tax=Stutzerimonas balearica TaxID=74829 RepID=UPI001F26447C